MQAKEDAVPSPLLGGSNSALSLGLRDCFLLKVMAVKDAALG